MTLAVNPSTLSKVRVASSHTMRAITFQGLFGYLHRPESQSADTGVVLIAPLGRDARCAHRPMRLFADHLAAAGVPTLRYDHRGTGDSLPLHGADAEALSEWLCGVGHAVETLKAQTGVKRIILGGVRLGATLATLSVEQADGLILLAPVLNGRSWLRRLRFSAGAAADRAAAGDDAPLDSDGLELSAASAAALARIDLDALPALGVPTFVAAQNKLVEAWADKQVAAGGPVRRAGFEGFRDLFLDAHSNRPPLAVFSAARQWLTADVGVTLGAPRPAPGAPPSDLKGHGVIDQAVQIGAGLQGVLSAPEIAEQAVDTAVLFLNTGGDPRCGIGGFATETARTLARRGVASLRFDFAGLGDSPLPDEGEPSHVYETPRDADIDAAVTFMAERGARHLVVVGVCAGAYHALHAAWRDPRVTAVFVVSPVKLIWRAGDSLAFGRKDDGKATQVYASAATQPETWLRLLRGEIDVAAVARTLASRLQARFSAVATRYSADAPSVQMERFMRRGGRACMIMGLDDSSLDEVEAHLGPKGHRLSRTANGQVRIHPNLDHGLARRQSRQIARDNLLDFLGLDPR